MVTLPRNFPAVDTGWLDVDDQTSLSYFLDVFRQVDGDEYQRTATAHELVQYGIWIGLLIAADGDTPDPSPAIESFMGRELQLA